jgi:hypothetical protein
MNVDRPIFKVQAQKLSQYPTGCGSEWCTFPNDSCTFIAFDININREDATYPYWKKATDQYRTCIKD